jgi:two-component system alkaline phosphatase synthesis response regulator PhoP
MNQSRILIVDDEVDLCQILKYNLEDKGYLTDVVYSAEQALNLDLNAYNLLLLDVMMDGISGFELLTIIRNEKRMNIPVIFITAMSSESNLIEGFNLGADDYIKKPFSLKEVFLRVNAVLDRYKHHTSIIPHQDEIKLDSYRKQVYLKNGSIELTRTEYSILSLLYNQPGKVYSRKEILQRIWSDQQDILGRTVDVNITRIRKKMGQWGNCIVTRSGYGYYYDSSKITSLV